MSSTVYGSITITDVTDGENGPSLYTWYVYTNNKENKSEYSLDSEGKEYMGVAANQATPLVSLDQITDIGIFSWSQISIKVINQIEQYYKTSSNNTPSSSNSDWLDEEAWTTTMPNPWKGSDDTKYYIWKRQKTFWSNNTVTYVGLQLLNDYEVVTALAKNDGKSIGEWCDKEGITIIHGATIMTGTVAAAQIAADAITAEKIKTGAITAEKLSTDAITSRNYYKKDAEGKYTAELSGYGAKLNLADGTWASKNFEIDKEGKITATSGSFSGHIEATSGSFSGHVEAEEGQIANFNIVGNRLTSGNGDGFVNLQSAKYPQDYVLAEYIESSGTQYIDTGVYSANNITIEVDTQLFTATSVYGSSTGYRYTAGTSSSYFYYFYSHDGNNQGYKIAPSSDRTVIKQEDNICYRDGTSQTSFVQKAPYKDSYSIFLFASNNKGSKADAGRARIYGCKIWEDDKLIRNFIPVYRNNEFCMYETCYGQYYTNKGTGVFNGTLSKDAKNTFIEQDGSSYQVLDYIESFGAQFIDTGVSGNNDNLKIEAKFTMLDFSSYAGVFGNYAGEQSKCWRLLLTNVDNNSYYATTNIRAQGSDGVTIPKGVVNSITLSKDKIIINNVATALANRGDATANDSTIVLFAQASSSGYARAKMRLYEFRIYDNGSLVRNYVPVLKDKTTYGLYDLKNKVFYGNNGTGAFTGAELTDEFSAIYLGAPTPEEAPFSVTNTGKLKAESGMIAGWTIDSNKLTSGIIGEDGSFGVFPKGILSGLNTSADELLASGDAWVMTAGSKFGVTRNGALYATNANISGTITAESGKIGGWSIENGGASSKNNILVNRSNGKTDGTSTGMASLDGTDFVAFWAGCPESLTPWEYNKTGRDYAEVTPFFVTSQGYLHAASGDIAGWSIEENHFGTLGTSLGSSGGIHLYPNGTQLSNDTLFGSSGSKQWTLGIGENFGVTTDGVLYAKAGKIGNTLIGDIAPLSQVTGVNLLKKDKVYGMQSNNGNEYVINKTTSTGGLKIDESIFKSKEIYTLSFYLQKNSGTLDRIGGHAAAFSTLKITIDGTEITGTTWQNTIVNNTNGININDTNKHYITVTLQSTGKGTSDDNLYIQANRLQDININYTLSEVKVEKGEKATPWCLAPDDAAASFSVTKDGEGNGFGWSLDKNGFYLSKYTSNQAEDVFFVNKNGEAQVGGWYINEDGLIAKERIQIDESSSQSQETTFAFLSAKVGGKEGVVNNVSDKWLLSIGGNFGVNTNGHLNTSKLTSGGWILDEQGLMNSNTQIHNGSITLIHNISENPDTPSLAGMTIRGYGDIGSSLQGGSMQFISTNFYIGDNEQKQGLLFQAGTTKTVQVDVKVALDGTRLFVGVKRSQGDTSSKSTLPSSISFKVSLKKQPWIGNPAYKDVYVTISAGTTLTKDTYMGKYHSIGYAFDWSETYWDTVWADGIKDCVEDTSEFTFSRIQNFTEDTGNIYSYGNLLPNHSLGTGQRGAGQILGSAMQRWRLLYVGTEGVDSTSDERLKNIDDIQVFNKYSGFFDKLTPISYTIKGNDSGSKMLGFGAQSVKQALLDSGLTEYDFDGYRYNGEDGYDSLCYDQFIPLNTWQIQKLKPRVSSLEQTILEYETRISNLENQLKNLTS